MTIELYNNTASPIALSSTAYWLCSPFVYKDLASLAPAVTIPAGGYATVPWPAGFTDVDAGGEVILYLDANTGFGDGLKIMDFVCWGTNPHGSRLALAAGAGKWSSDQASACAPALGAGALHRVAGSAGTDATHYDTTSPPSPQTCP
ncbi:MAG: hypothetical protein H6708_02190 [Kofleriaceae bacterium]|nr:hypothetical protein [Kofleriaceae bacterium]